MEVVAWELPNKVVEEDGAEELDVTATDGVGVGVGIENLAAEEALLDANEKGVDDAEVTCGAVVDCKLKEKLEVDETGGATEGEAEEELVVANDEEKEAGV